MAKVYLALGSNVGDSEHHFKNAVELLSKKISGIKQAPLYKSKAVGFTEQDDFVNTAVSGQTDLSPKELLEFVKSTEKEVGRIDRFRWGPREIDIDIIFYNDQIVDEPHLHIPHAHFAERDFVLRPIMDLDPNLIDPRSKKTVQELHNKLPADQLSILEPAHDAIVVLATQPDTETWEFPKQIYECLDKAAKLFKAGKAPFIITSGDRSISIVSRGLKQPFKECDKLADYLVEQAIPSSKILREGESRDSISNLYYLKTNFFIPRKTRNILFVVADFRIPRLEFLCKRILGPDYKVTFVPISAEVGPSYNERHTMKIQKEFLEPMKDGEHGWLNDKFYDSSMYKYWAEHDRQKYGLK